MRLGKDRFYLITSLLVAFLSFLGLLVYIKNPYLAFSPLIILIWPVFFIAKLILGIVPIDFNFFYMLKSFSYDSLIFFSILIIACFIFGTLLSLGLSLIRERKVLSFATLKKIGMILIFSLIASNGYLLIYIDNIDTEKIEKYCTNPGGERSGAAVKECQIDALSKLAKKEGNTNCDLSKIDEGIYDNICIVSYYSQKDPYLFCPGERYSCKSWQDMINRTKVIEESKEIPELEKCSSLIKNLGLIESMTIDKGGYVQHLKWKEEYEKCVYEVVILEKENFCDKIELNQKLKDGCLLELGLNSSSQLLTKDMCKEYLGESVSSTYEYEKEPLFSCISDKNLSSHDFEIFIVEEMSKFYLGYLSNIGEDYKWHAQYNGPGYDTKWPLSLHQAEVSGKLHDNFLRLIDGRQKIGAKTPWPESLDAFEEETRRIDLLPTLEKVETLEVLDITIQNIQLSKKSGIYQYDIFIKNNTLIILEWRENKEIEGISRLDLIKNFIENSYIIPKKENL